ncbi:MAG: hypothetical protein Q7S51_03360, partial [Gallionellaceae bacterium]|nr:hypothetical protein [Gallionellaceae bacterium]
TGPSISETNQRLEISIPATSLDDPTNPGFSAGYSSICSLRGDYDIQVDYDLLSWPTANGVRISISTGSGPIERTSFGSEIDFYGAPREVYLTHFSDGVQGVIPTGDLSGKLRLVRTNGTITGYYYASGNWIMVNSTQTTTNDVGIGLHAWSHNYAFTNQDVKLAFDNLVLNQGELICPTLSVSIDIKPGSFPNSINPSNMGETPVAILSNSSFDATTVDPLSVMFGPYKAMESHQKGHIEDVDGDGDLDMVLHFGTQSTGIQCGDTSASLTGKTSNGTEIKGTDTVVTKCK